MGLVWLLAVAAVGSVTYLVVDRAGQEIGDVRGTPRVVAGPSVRASSTSAPPTRTSPRPTPTRTKKPTPTPSPTRTTATVAPQPTSTPATTTTEPTRTATPSPTRSTRTDSFSTRGGTVVASCTGDRIEVESITPRDGWRIERDVEGDQLEVHFTSAEDEVEIKIRCVGGVPTKVGD